MPNHKVESVDGVVGLEGEDGVILASKEAGLSFVAPGKDSYIVLDTKNLAILKAGDNSVAIYDDTATGGMIDIQANSNGAVNVAVQNGATQNTALTITDGKAHLGVFTPATHERLHVEKGKITVESAVGTPALYTELSKVEVTPSKVTLECCKSTMEVTVDGFDFKNAANTFEMHLNSAIFQVKGAGGFLFEMDIVKQELAITGLKVAVESIMQTTIHTIENTIKVRADKIEADALLALQKVEAAKKETTTLKQDNAQAIRDLQNQINNLGGCWVARVVFGEEDYRWQLFRHWLFGQDFHPDHATWLQAAYLRHGPWFAEVVRRHPWLRKLLLPVMARCIRGLNGVPHQAFGRAAWSRPVSLISQAIQ